MSCTARSISGYSGFTRASGRARSEPAGRLDEQLKRFVQHRDETATIQLSKYRTLNHLKEVVGACSVRDWGGNNELPISSQTAKEAVSLLEALPLNFSNPDVSPEPMGSIAFEWRFAPMRTIVLSVAGRGTIEYAGLLGPIAQFHGRSPFTGDLPEFVFRQLMSARGG